MDLHLSLVFKKGDIVDWPEYGKILLEKCKKNEIPFHVGFELTPLGPASFAINGVPAGIEGLNPSSLIQDIVAAAVPVNHDSLALNSEVALQLARHAAIPYGQQLTNEEMDVLVNDLFACSNVNYTPDGHPILCILPQQDIEQLLG